jgi:succinoglycan biosynthesis protein ExoM
MDTIPFPASFTSAAAIARSVSVVIPTFRRPQGLVLAMNSVVAQLGLDDISLSMIVCDNSPEASARAQVAAFAASAPIAVTYVHEPKTGVANARNSAVAAAYTDFIAFLDDDEEAPPTWLSALLETQTRFDADVVFGPVSARLMADSVQYPHYFEAFFSRKGPDVSQTIDGYYGCGNSLIRRAVMPANRPFCVEHNDMGGEDDKLFYGLQAKGARMAWSAEATVFEDVPASRSTLSYTLRRAFAFGQGPSFSAALGHKPLTCAGWMLQGAVQGLLFFVIGGAMYLMGKSESAARLDKAARGFGKLMWFPPFKIGFYGQALLRADAPGR